MQMSVLEIDVVQMHVRCISDACQMCVRCEWVLEIAVVHIPLVRFGISNSDMYTFGMSSMGFGALNIMVYTWR